MRKTVKDTILVLTNTNEHAVNLVAKHFREANQPFLRIDTNEFLSKKIGLKWSHDQNSCSVMFDKRRELDTARVKTVWSRHPTLYTLSENIPPKHAEFIVGEYRSFLWSLSTCIDAFWMNPPLSVRLLEHNKLKQRLDATRIGLRTPTTLITTDPQRILNFCKQHGEQVVLKTIRPSLVKQGRKRGGLLVFTTPISVNDIVGREAEIGLAPVMVQEYVEKKLEFRATIVGNKVFTCAIHSQDSERTKYDWRRYDFEKVKHEVYHLPVKIEKKLLALMRNWGLTYGAMDLILAPSGEFVFLEVNPTGQWGWIEHLTHMPISQAIADLLMHPPTKNSQLLRLNPGEL